MEQTLADRVQAAKESAAELDALLREYRPFILSAVLANSPKAQEDYIQAGMLAFAQAVRTFAPEKGAFLSFAKLIISRRVIDCIRRDTAHPELAVLDTNDAESRQLIDTVSRHAHSLQSEQEARREEILLLTKELRAWSMSFQDLSAAAPRHASTRKICKAAVRALLDDAALLEAFRRKKQVPVKALAKTLGVKPKLLEDHRRYLVAAVLVHSGDYPFIREYVRLDDAQEGGERQ